MFPIKHGKTYRCDSGLNVKTRMLLFFVG